MESEASSNRPYESDGELLRRGPMAEQPERETGCRSQVEEIIGVYSFIPDQSAQHLAAKETMF
jgi:hypothetical protein